MKKSKALAPSAAAPDTRAYLSPLRQAQAALTRERILNAARTYLETQPTATLTLRRVAELAGVSSPTVYAHFPTMDDLVAAFFHWLKPQIGLDGPMPPLAAWPALPARLFPRYRQHRALVRNLMNQPAWDRQREADRGARHGQWIGAVAQALPHLKPEQQRRGALVVAAFTTPTVWRWLMDTCHFTPDEAESAAAWAIDTLVRGLQHDAGGLSSPPEEPSP